MSDVLTTSHEETAKPANWRFDPKQVEAYRGTDYELIPLHAPDAKNSEGRSIGKAPLKGWRTSEPITVDDAALRLTHSNVGVRLGDRDLVIDVDPRNFASNDDPLQRLQDDLRIDLGPDQYPRVITGSGGFHIYTRLAEPKRLRDSLPEYQGVEFKSVGRQVVAAGSCHPDFNAPYVFDHASSSKRLADGVPDAPKALIEACARPEVSSVAKETGDVTAEQLSEMLDGLDVTKYREQTAWLEMMMACHEATAGGGRDEFVGWSTGDPQYAGHAHGIASRWDSLHSERQDRRVTRKTLFKALHKAGEGHRIPDDRASAEEDFAGFFGDQCDEDLRQLGARPLTGPVDLWQHHKAPGLPDGLLPRAIEEFARVNGRAIGGDTSAVAMACLAACAGSLRDSVKLKVKRHGNWMESARLWVALVGSPSTKKSPMISAALGPVREMDRRIREPAKKALERWKALEPKVRGETPRPRQPALILNDTTPEALQMKAADSPEGLLLYRDELSGWLNGMDRYSKGAGERSFWLEAYEGRPFNVDRATRDPLLIGNLSVGIVGGIQPDVIRQQSDVSDDGLLQRFLPIVLRPAELDRDEPMQAMVSSEYGRIVTKLNELEPPAAGYVSMSDEALRIRREMATEHLTLADALGGQFGAYFIKQDGIFPRLCLLFECIKAVADFDVLDEDPNGEPLLAPDEVSGETAAQVARFMREFLRPHAVAFYHGILGQGTGYKELIAVANLIVSERLTEIGAREIQRSTGSLRSLTAQEARSLCERLESYGWVGPATSGKAQRWKVNPRVHDLFVKRGETERERKAKAREALVELFKKEDA